MNSMNMTIRSSVRRNSSGVSRKIISLFAILLLGFFLCPAALRADTETDAPKEDIETLKAKADQGDAEAQYDLGVCYDFGDGVPKDKAEALNWYRKAAEQGHAKAQFYLGICYACGEGVSEDKAEATNWFRKAADQGYADAQYILGCCYYDGEGVPEDKAEAVSWYRKAAEQGYAPAQYSLGVCYSKGEGVEKNEEEAKKWHQKAADQGYPPIMSSLFRPLFWGIVIVFFVVSIVFFYRKYGLIGSLSCWFSWIVCVTIGAVIGFLIGAIIGLFIDLFIGDSFGYSIGGSIGGSIGFFIGFLICTFIGSFIGDKIAEAISKIKTRKAAERGDAEAQFKLGTCCLNGNGVPKDEAEAANWFRKAAEQGHKEAAESLKRLSE